METGPGTKNFSQDNRNEPQKHCVELAHPGKAYITKKLTRCLNWISLPTKDTAHHLPVSLLDISFLLV
uniref:Uncharacterized protein n=1 Tax=Scleropages formosus TaxID=113540 RepID=A0A8C9VXZ1_SCLFO